MLPTPWWPQPPKIRCHWLPNMEAQSSIPSFKAEAVTTSATTVKNRGTLLRSAPRRRLSRSTATTATAIYTSPMSVYSDDSTCSGKPQSLKMWPASTKLNMWVTGAASVFTICQGIMRLTAPHTKDAENVGYMVLWGSSEVTNAPRKRKRT